MIQKFIGLSAANKKALSGTERFEKAANLREAVQSLGSDPTSPLYYIAHQGVLEFNRSKELGNSSEVVVDNVRRALRQGVGTELARLQSSLSILATCANTAPFIGLFGTVWGIMGGPQIFLKDLSSGSVTRVSKNGTYNTEANLSPDGTLVVYSRMSNASALLAETHPQVKSHPDH